MQLAHPAWLLLLLLLPLLGVAAVLVARLRRRQWSAFVAPRLRGALLKRGSDLPRWFALFFLLAACGALIAALARPQGNAGTRTEKALGRNVLIALDLSRSMRVADVKPDRLTRAKMTAYELLEAMPNERVGLIGFAGSAYVYAPLTVDHQAVRETIEQIDETWTTRGGSNIGEALRLAIKTLKETGQKNNALVILSDGEKHDDRLDDLIDEARQAGVYILTIGVGTEDGDYVPNPDFAGGRMVDRGGQPVISRLQPAILRKLASETKGRYAVAGSGADIAAMVNDVVKDLDAFEIEGRERAVMIEFYQWLVLPAILFLMATILAGTRWRSVQTAMLAGGMLLLPSTARADGVSDARNALRKGDYPAARGSYQKLAEGTRLKERRARFKLGEAAAAERMEDFRAARTAYSEALLSEEPAALGRAHLGMGRTLFQLGWLGLDENPYPADAPESAMLEHFENLVRDKLDAMSREDEGGRSAEEIESVITNWTDAVRHFNSARARGLPADLTDHNRKVVMVYLKRLQELLDEEKQQTEQSMPQPQQGEGQPQPQQGDGDPQESGEDGEPKEGGPEKPGDKGEGEDEPKEKGEGGDESEKPEDKSGKRKDGEEKEKPGDPNESPEDRARRILSENADLEKGPLTPGRHEFNPPEKDW
ncbi:MAG: VWA domain-containing protein [Akkermansiaceae bacterium]|nr:VWA domain-containing protein [Akkermansiaceae bacterium]